MGESKEERVGRLLQEGLDLYGLGEISAAIVTWEKVLELDPSNADALDYIRTADRRKTPRPPKKKGQLAGAVAAVLQEARALMRQDDFATALDLLRSAHGQGFDGLEFEATMDLARSRLHRAYQERIPDLGCVPHVDTPPGSLTRFNLPPAAGFVLSMVDGSTSVADLISLSGMDAFEALHALCGLVDVGVVDLRQ